MTRAIRDLPAPGVIAGAWTINVRETRTSRGGNAGLDQQARIAKIERCVGELRAGRDGSVERALGHPCRGQGNGRVALLVATFFKRPSPARGRRTGRIARSAFAGASRRGDRMFSPGEHDMLLCLLWHPRTARRLAATKVANPLETTRPGGVARRRCLRVAHDRREPEDREKRDCGNPEVAT